MNSYEQVALVERYFAAVDGENLQILLQLLQDDCTFTVETHGVQLNGLNEISGMFRRLWDNHEAVRHLDFVHVPDPTNGRIASRFKVENTEHNGAVTHKSNCNFFEIQNGRFAAIAVYMAGQNTLDSADV